jgi:multiple sugar transport system permease protein
MSSTARAAFRAGGAGPLMALPALLGLAIFVAVPFLFAVGLSLTDLRLGSPLPVRFVGLEQYRRLLADETFRRALLNNVLFALAAVPLQTGVALGLALLLDRPLRGRAVFRTLFFLPVVFPLSLVAVIWVLVYAPGPDGPMNAFLSTVTFGAWVPRDFLNDPNWALPAILFTSIWQGAGFQMVILLAGLQAVPRQLYEAAEVDGAGTFARFRHVTLPQLGPTIAFVVLVTTILAFRLFDQVQVMTQGGPDGASTTMMYEAAMAAFRRRQVAAGSAMTVVLFAFVFGLTVLYRVFVRRGRSA